MIYVHPVSTDRNATSMSWHRVCISVVLRSPHACPCDRSTPAFPCSKVMIECRCVNISLISHLRVSFGLATRPEPCAVRLSVGLGSLAVARSSPGRSRRRAMRQTHIHAHTDPSLTRIRITPEAGCRGFRTSSHPWTAEHSWPPIPLGPLDPFATFVFPSSRALSSKRHRRDRTSACLHTGPHSAMTKSRVSDRPDSAPP